MLSLPRWWCGWIDIFLLQWDCRIVLYVSLFPPIVVYGIYLGSQTGLTCIDPLPLNSRRPNARLPQPNLI